MRSITDVLVEFPRADTVPPAAEPPPPVPAYPDPVEAAREAGWAAGYAFGEAERDREREEARAEREREVAAARSRWAAGEGAALAEAMRQGLAALEDALDAAVAAALMPAMAAGLRSRASAAVADAVGRLLAAGWGGGLIEVRGPADLLAPVRDAFADRDVVRVTEADTPECLLTAGDTGAMSQIEAWRSRLQATLEAAA